MGALNIDKDIIQVYNDDADINGNNRDLERRRLNLREVKKGNWQKRANFRLISNLLIRVVFAPFVFFRLRS